MNNDGKIHRNIMELPTRNGKLYLVGGLEHVLFFHILEIS